MSLDLYLVTGSIVNVHNLTPVAASQLHGDAGQVFISPLVSSSLPSVLDISVSLGPQFPPSSSSHLWENKGPLSLLEDTVSSGTERILNLASAHLNPQSDHGYFTLDRWVCLLESHLCIK